VLGLVFLGDLAGAAITLGGGRLSARSAPSAPSWLLALAGRPVVVGLVAVVGAVAVLIFMRRAGRIAAPAVALAAGALLNEGIAAAFEGPMRCYFGSGAALLGWILGTLYARALGPRDRGSRQIEAFAELGAAACLSATYVAAAISKLAAQGLSWADGANLRALVLSQHPVDASGPLAAYARLVAAAPSFAFTLAALTLIAQLGALAYPFGRRARALSGTLLCAFHLNVRLLVPILFVGPVVLLVAWSYPWPRLWRWHRDGWLPPPADPDADRTGPGSGGGGRAAAALVAALGVAVLLAWTLPVRAYTRSHHGTSRDGTELGGPGHEPLAASVPPSPAVVALLGGLLPGDTIAGWKLDGIVGPVEGAREVRLFVARGRGRMRVAVTLAGRRPFPPPRRTDRYQIFYDAAEGVDEGARETLLDELARRIGIAEKITPPPPGM
jgi:hypothetical protein